MKLMRVAVVALLCLVAPAAAAEKNEVNLLAMGDWGNNGANQKIIAAALKKHVQTSGKTYSGMLLAGDNFYVPLTGVNDPKWRSMFEDLYDPKILNFPFYVSLGNHDYQENKHLIELAYSKENPQSRWKLPGLWHRVDLPEKDPLVTVFMLNSNRPLMGEVMWNEQMDWLAAELAKPRKAKWVMAVAHHPFYSNGDHGDNGVLRNAWGALFEKANLDFYICGHDHDLQHIEMKEWKPTFLLVGGGGATTRPMRNDQRGPFSKAMYGFASLEMTEKLASVRFISKDGETLHAFTRTPAGKVEVLETTKSDAAVPRTPKTINAPESAK